MAKACRPYAEPASLRSASICRPNAVEESARLPPTIVAALPVRPNRKYAASAIATLLASTCSKPVPNTARRITHNRCGDNSRPITNSISTMPNSEIVLTPAVSPTSPISCGPIATPASR